MKRFVLLLVSGLLASVAASAQTTPTNSPTTTRSTNTTGLGGTVSGTPTSTDATPGAPARYDDRNSGLPSGQVKMKTGRTKQAKAAKKQSAM